MVSLGFWMRVCNARDKLGFGSDGNVMVKETGSDDCGIGHPIPRINRAWAWVSFGSSTTTMSCSLSTISLIVVPPRYANSPFIFQPFNDPSGTEDGLSPSQMGMVAGFVEAMPRLPDSITVSTGSLIESATAISRIAHEGMHPSAVTDRLFDGNADIPDGVR